MNKSIYFMKDWGVLVLIFIIVAVFSISSALLYDINEKSYLESKAQRTALSIARTLESEIRHRSNTFKILGNSTHLFKAANFSKVASSLVAEYPDIYAVNLVRDDGIIEEVFPYEKNVAALGQNLLQREDVKNYLLQAKQTQAAQMSHKVLTYQNVPAFTLYVPLFDDKSKFLGWLNCVIDFDTWLKNFMDVNQMEDVRVVIKWINADSDIIDYGDKSTKDLFHFNYQILNQKIGIAVGFGSNFAEHRRNRYYWAMMSVGLTVLLLALLLMVLFNFSKIRLRAANERLDLKNSLISSVCHDLSSPLSVLKMCLEEELESLPMDDKKKQYIARSLESLGQILSTTKNIHASGLGILRVSLISVRLDVAVGDAVSMLKPYLEGKNIRVDSNGLTADMIVSADPSTLINNVVLNVLTNAIKFSPIRGVVRVRGQILPDSTRLIVEDDGEGLTDEQLKSFQRTGKIKSQKGTSAESGTGLGLIQIGTFMKMYGGHLVMERADSGGCRVVLVFQSVSVPHVVDQARLTI